MRDFFFLPEKFPDSRKPIPTDSNLPFEESKLPFEEPKLPFEGSKLPFEESNLPLEEVFRTNPIHTIPWPVVLGRVLLRKHRTYALFQVFEVLADV